MNDKTSATSAPPHPNPLLRSTGAEGTRLRFQARHRFAGGFALDATFESGNGITALFGPSGSGKTTILSILAGLLRPDAGCVSLNERVLLDTARHIHLPPERRSIGMIFQDHLLFPHLTVEANLRYGQRRRPTRQVDFDQLVDLLELRALLPRLPHSLSGGERQRTALGRAILRGPELLLMDEPLTGLDAALKDRILSYLARSVARWNIPTLLVSHDQADVRRLADHVIVIEAGRIIAAGPTATTLDRAVISTMATAPGPINLLRIAAVRQVGPHIEGQIGEQWLQLPGNLNPAASPGLVRFHPHDVTLARHEIAGLSIRNHLRGRIREIIPAGGRVFVAIDVGQFLWAEVTPEAVAELALTPGANVICLIKTSALEGMM